MLSFWEMPRSCYAADTVRLNFSVECRNGTFAECPNPFCRLMSEILSEYGKRIESLSDDRSCEESSAVNININITISHERSMLESIASYGKSIASFFTRTPASAPAMPAQENISADKPEMPVKAENSHEPKKYSRLEKFKFLDKTALVKIVSDNTIKDDDYFTKDGLTYCRIYPNGSPANYGFADRESMRKKLRGLYAGELSVSGMRSFSFKSEGGNFDSIADSALLSLESLRLVSSDNDIPQEITDRRNISSGLTARGYILLLSWELGSNSTLPRKTAYTAVRNCAKFSGTKTDRESAMTRTADE